MNKFCFSLFCLTPVSVWLLPIISQHADELGQLQNKYDSCYQENIQTKKQLRAYERQLQEVNSEFSLVKNQLSSLEDEHARMQDSNARALEDYRGRVKKVLLTALCVG